MSTSRTSIGVVDARLEPIERLAAVSRQLDAVTLELERAPKRLAHGALVVHYEDAHAGIVRTNLKDS